MIRSTMIVEIAGTPPEHIKKALSEYMLTLNRMNEVEVHTIKISDPAPIPEQDGMYTCFAEADFSVSAINKLTEIVFDFMPSSIEVTDPTSVQLDAIQATELFNLISGRMHKYDDIAKASYAKIRQLTAALQKQTQTGSEKGNQIQKKKSTIKKTSKKKSVRKIRSKKKKS